MTICDKKAIAIYPDLNPAPPSQHQVNPQNYKLAKISKVEAYLFLYEISKRDKLAKNEAFSYYFKYC